MATRSSIRRVIAYKAGQAPAPHPKSLFRQTVAGLLASPLKGIIITLFVRSIRQSDRDPRVEDGVRYDR